MKTASFSIGKPDRKDFDIILVILSITFLCCFNILYFISQVANSLIRSDAWYLLDKSIRKWSFAGVDFADFFAKRGFTDHALPLNKIALLLNYKLFGLDFKFEAIIGFFGLYSIISMFLILFVQRMKAGYANWLSAIAFLNAILIITSINTTGIYTWSLVTFGFLPLFLAFATSLMTWKFLVYESAFAAGVIGAVMTLLIGDTAAIVLWVSLSVTVGMFLLSGDKIAKHRAIKWGLFSGAYVCAYFVFVNYKFIVKGLSNGGIGSQNQSHWLDPFFYMEAIRIVFSSSLIYSQHFIYLGKYAVVASWVVALFVLYFYVRHFVILFSRKEEHSRERFLTTFILIYAAISIVAIIFGRIPVFGVDYLNQPRYVLIYQLIPFALMMDFVYSWTRKEMDFSVVRRFLFYIATLLFFWMQFAFFVGAYASVSWVSRYVDKQAKAIGNYLIDPSMPSGSCTTLSQPLCQMSIEKRNELLNLLKKEQLNLISHTFQWKYRIFPFERSVMPEVLDWGPKVVRPTANAVGIWIKLSSPLLDARSEVVARIGDQVVGNVFMAGDVIRFGVPKIVTKAVGRYTMELSDDKWKTQVPLGYFEVIHN